ncbi:radical SAM protein [Chloroflexota bacterium]
MTLIHQETQSDMDLLPLSTKLWIYTNYDCNLQCSYCVAGSHPKAPKRAIQLTTVTRIIEEALDLGFESIYFTGGEPFILGEIFKMLAYSSDKLTTTILTNGMLFRGRRLDHLTEIKNKRLILQVSLDGSRPEHQDPYRGRGSWQKTVDGIKILLKLDFRVRISTTETSTNTKFMEEICDFRRSLGISDEDHIIRPLAKRGFSDEGVEVGKHNLIPEMTINDQGVYWHPLSTDPDLLVRTEIFPLADAYSQIKMEFAAISGSRDSGMEEFH